MQLHTRQIHSHHSLHKQDLQTKPMRLSLLQYIMFLNQLLSNYKKSITISKNGQKDKSYK